MARLIRHGRLDLTQSVSATYSLSDVETGIAHLSSSSSDAIRIVVLP